MYLLAVVDLLLRGHGIQSLFQCLSSERHQCLWCEALWMSNTISACGRDQVEEVLRLKKTPFESNGVGLHLRLLSSRALDFRYISVASRFGESAERRVLVLEW